MRPLRANKTLTVIVGSGVRIEWRPRLKTWDAFRFKDQQRFWNNPWAQPPKFRTASLLDAATWALSPHSKKEK